MFKLMVNLYVFTCVPDVQKTNVFRDQTNTLAYSSITYFF